MADSVVLTTALLEQMQAAVKTYQTAVENAANDLDSLVTGLLGTDSDHFGGDAADGFNEAYVSVKTLLTSASEDLPTMLISLITQIQDAFFTQTDTPLKEYNEEVFSTTATA